MVLAFCPPTHFPHSSSPLFAENPLSLATNECSNVLIERLATDNISFKSPQHYTEHAKIKMSETGTKYLNNNEKCLTSTSMHSSPRPVLSPLVISGISVVQLSLTANCGSQSTTALARALLGSYISSEDSSAVSMLSLLHVARVCRGM